VLSASALSAIAGGAENDVLGDGYLPIEEVWICNQINFNWVTWDLRSRKWEPWSVRITYYFTRWNYQDIFLQFDFFFWSQGAPLRPSPLASDLSLAPGSSGVVSPPMPPVYNVPAYYTPGQAMMPAPNPLINGVPPPPQPAVVMPAQAPQQQQQQQPGVQTAPGLPGGIRVMPQAPAPAPGGASQNWWPSSCECIYEHWVEDGTLRSPILDSAFNLGPLISHWEINELENCWYKSVRILEVLKLLFQQILNLSSSQWDVSGPILRALSNNRWLGDPCLSVSYTVHGLRIFDCGMATNKRKKKKKVESVVDPQAKILPFKRRISPLNID
jgi:hypothetical protein